MQKQNVSLTPENFPALSSPRVPLSVHNLGSDFCHCHQCTCSHLPVSGVMPVGCVWVLLSMLDSGSSVTPAGGSCALPGSALRGTNQSLTQTPADVRSVGSRVCCYSKASTVKLCRETLFPTYVFIYGRSGYCRSQGMYELAGNYIREDCSTSYQRLAPRGCMVASHCVSQ